MVSNATNTWQGVRDTAFWVALYRARESLRADRLFSDKWAAHLIGEDNARVIGKLPRIFASEWKYSLRTVTIDTFIQNAIDHESIDVVVNLGAGLDMRPYRLEVPSHIVWVEVDLPEVIAYKEKKIASFTPYPIPHCLVKRMGCDLSKKEELTKVFNEIATFGKRCLIVTEGLLIYLEQSQVAELMNEVASHSETIFWVTDYHTDFMVSWYKKTTQLLLSHLKMAFKFSVPKDKGATHFEQFGWKPVADISMFDAAFKYNRRPPFLVWAQASLGLGNRASYVRAMSGCCLLKKIRLTI